MTAYSKHLIDTLLASGPSVHDYIDGVGNLATALPSTVYLKDDQLQLDKIDPYYFRKVTRFTPGEHYVTFREHPIQQWRLGLLYISCGGQVYRPILGLYQLKRLRAVDSTLLCSSFHTILQIKPGILPSFTNSQLLSLCDGELVC